MLIISRRFQTAYTAYCESTSAALFSTTAASSRYFLTEALFVPDDISIVWLRVFLLTSTWVW